MWSTFLVACAVALLVMYAPGLLLLVPTRSLTWSIRLAAAPLVCVAFYGSVAIVYPVLGISASPLTLVAPIVLLGLVLLVARGLCSRRGAGVNEAHGSLLPTCRELLVFATYAVVGVALTTMVFVRNLDGATSFFQAYDNGNHLNMVRVFLETENFSSFNSSAYAAEGSVAPVVSASGFYPAAWHLLVALVVSLTDAPITLGVNAVNAMLLGVVFPLSMCALLSRLFGRDSRTALFGAVACLAFCSSVWDFVSFGPLYPMLLSYVFVPVTTACFITLFDANLHVKRRGVYVLTLIVGCVSIALAQPSGIFLMAVILAPFLVWRAYVMGQRAFHGNRAGSVACSAATALFVVAVWMLCYHSPFFQSTVSFTWPATASLRQAVADVALFSMCDHEAQPLLACFVAIGLVLACTDKKKRWLAFSYLFAAITYVVCVTSEGDLKHILGGFWYTDSHRLAANVAIIATPFAAMGADYVYRVALLAFDWIAARLDGCPSGKTVSCLTLLLSCVIIFYPSFTLRGIGDVKTSFGSLEEKIKGQNDTRATHVLNDEEIEFAMEALSLVPEGALIINYANDGSGFLYSLLSANMYYRNFALPTGGVGETEESRTIRGSLDEIATNASVRDAVETVGARYVLFLDQGESEEEGRDFFWSNYPDQYPGLVRITDDTPGFTVLLSQGDMRLYRIDE